MHLSPDQRGVAAGELAEQRTPACDRHDQHVVGDRRRRRGGRGSDRRQELLRCGEVDDSVDAHVCVGHPGASDGDAVADADAEVRRHLLGDQDARAGADELAQLSGECRSVVTGTPSTSPALADVVEP